MLRHQTASEHYWTEHFEVTDEDVEFLFNVFLDGEKPLSSAELASRLVAFRIEREAQLLRRQIQRGEIFQPKDVYQVGQTLVFPAMDYAIGQVTDMRPGKNPEHGQFTVIQVRFENGESREFASALQTPHELNIDFSADTQGPAVSEADVKTIVRSYGDDILYLVEERLRSEPDAIYFAGRWFLKSLLSEVTIAHLHLAEAVLVIHNGGPLETERIIKEIDLPAEVNRRLQTFSLDYAMFRDERFDEVGPAGRVLWCLREMEPPEVLSAPERLRYNTVNREGGYIVETDWPEDRNWRFDMNKIEN